RMGSKLSLPCSGLFQVNSIGGCAEPTGSMATASRSTRHARPIIDSPHPPRTHSLSRESVFLPQRVRGAGAGTTERLGEVHFQRAFAPCCFMAGNALPGGVPNGLDVGSFVAGVAAGAAGGGLARGLLRRVRVRLRLDLALREAPRPRQVRRRGPR